MKWLILSGLLFMTLGCEATSQKLAVTLETYRPAFHFSPAAGWINDPNGLVYYEGEYHLFYQYHPDDTVWGPMHWGHAVSRDLHHWQELPIALFPDENGTIFSGSAIIDWHNTAGFGKEAMVAIFTHADDPIQQQSLAYSTDNGRTWTKYDGNPVLKPLGNMPDFRDPKVIWYGDQETGHWVMPLAAGQAILFFKSADLKSWESTGGFGLTDGAHDGFWETPDLFELPVQSTDATRWVLTVGVGSGAPAGGSGQQYFIGHFDGETFANENDPETVLWADYGADFYAGQSWSDAPDGRRVWLGWLNNWTYASKLPTATKNEGWRGAMSLPRELALVYTADGIRMVQTPVTEFARLRGETQRWQNEVIRGESDLLDGISAETVDIVAEFKITPETDLVGIRVRVGNGQQTSIGYGHKQCVLFIDRSESGATTFSDDFTLLHTAPLESENDIVKLHIIVDRASVEVFANDGLVVMTEQIFPDDNATGLSVFTNGSAVSLRHLAVTPLIAKP
jgi:sucrose-6-phosphate hydrolase SacC (GH32 family)